MFNWVTKAVNNDGKHENLLNKIVYGNIFTNQIAIWYDTNRIDYIERGYQGNAMVYAIIRKICDKIKGADLYTFIEKPDKKGQSRYKNLKYSSDPMQRAIGNIFKKKELIYSEDNPVADLIKKPNSYQRMDEFVDAVAGFYFLTGEAFIYGVGPGEDSINHGKFTELHVMPSHLVTIVMGDWKNPIKGYKLMIGDNTIEIPASDVLHLKMFNPKWDAQGSQLRGQAPLLAGMKWVKKNDDALLAAAKGLQNEGAKGIISPNVQDPKLWPNPEQRKATDDRVEERIHGGQNANRIVVSSMPLRYDAIGLSPVAMAILEGMGYDDEKLCSLWGVNPVLFQPNATHANLEHAQKDLVTNIVVPFHNMFEKELTGFIADPYREEGKDYVLDFDTSIYAELRPDLKLMKEVFDTWQVKGNEFREMVGLDAGDDPVLDTHVMPMGLITSEEMMNPADEPLNDDDFKDYK